MEKKKITACISLKGELANMGKHIYLHEAGVTLCGFFTVDYDKAKFKDMPKEGRINYAAAEFKP